MTRRALQAFIATLLAAAVSITGAAGAAAEDPPDEDVNLRCIAESLLGVPVDDHPDNDTLCALLVRNQNCTGTGESRVCDDETPWPEHIFNAPWQRTNAERTKIRVAYIVERSLSAGCDHYITSDAATSGAHRLICLSQTVSRARVIACQSAVTALGYQRVHDLYVDGGTFNCPPAPRRRSTQSPSQTVSTAPVIEPESAEQRSVEPESAEQRSVEPESAEQRPVEPESAEQRPVEPESAEQRPVEPVEPESAEQRPRTRSASELAWIASKVATTTGQSCSVIDGRVTCAH